MFGEKINKFVSQIAMLFMLKILNSFFPIALEILFSKIKQFIYLPIVYQISKAHKKTLIELLEVIKIELRTRMKTNHWSHQQ